MLEDEGILFPSQPPALSGELKEPILANLEIYRAIKKVLLSHSYL